MNAIDVRPLALPVAVAALGAIVLVADAFVPVARKRALGWLVAAGLGAALVASFLLGDDGQTAGGAYARGPWVAFFERLFLGAGVLGVLGALDHLARAVPRRQGEYWVLLLFSLAGMMILPGARDLVLLVVCFELMGIPLYVLAAWAKTGAADGGPAGDARRGLAAEAAIKLYLVGAASTAITLFGLSLLVGMAGTTRLAGLAALPPTPIGTAGMLLVLGGLAFKIGVVPFHMWVPDTYEGASTPFVAFLSVAPKAAGIAAIVVVFAAGLGTAESAWLPALVAVCAVTMVAGNLLALPQTDAKRMLAYSGVAQMGYVLLALAAGRAAGLGTALFYLAGYVVTNTGAFLVVHAVERQGGGHAIRDLDGLARRSPWLAMALLIFLLSLAGVPFVVGFWAKLYVFVAAWRAGMTWLVALGALLAVVGLFYYLQIARAAFMRDPPAAAPIATPPALRLAILACLLAVVGLGAWPSPLFEAATRASAAIVGG